MIKLENITIKYNHKIIQENLNVDFSDVQVNFITGVSGCGKTSILNIIGLIKQDYKGKLWIDNNDCKNLKASKRRNFYRNKIGFLFQNYGLIENESINYNLLIALRHQSLSKSEKQKRIRAVLQELGIVHQVNQKIYTLSGGEQQRIALARLMLKNPSIILADEPTGSLDEENSRLVMKHLRQLSEQGKLVIIVTHDLSLIEAKDRWIQL